MTAVNVRREHAGAFTFLVAVIPAAAVATAATLIGAWDRFGRDGSTHHFVHSPEFKFWIFLLAAQTTLWLICFLLLWRITRSLRHDMEGASRREVWSVFLAFSVPLGVSVGLVPISTGLHYPLPHHQLRVFGLRTRFPMSSCCGWFAPAAGASHAACGAQRALRARLRSARRSILPATTAPCASRRSSLGNGF